MTIRRILLLFFLLMGLGPTTVLTGLAFFQARDALKLEITRNLRNEASALMQQIDRMMFERVQHVLAWSHLELMQEVRVGDVDKRLSHLLFDLNKHYAGVYKRLLGSDARGQIVAASDPAWVGTRMEQKEAWLTTTQAHGEVRLLPLSLGPLPGAASIEMEAAIHDPQRNEDVGKLHALFDWAEIFRLLDRSSQRQGAAPSLAVLFDAQGRVIAASGQLRERGLLLSQDLADWRAQAEQDAVIADPDGRLGFREVLAGSAKTQGYHGFHGFGWTVQVYQPTDQAFAPIENMALVFFILLGFTSAAAVILSLLIAEAIARPITQLTQMTRSFMRKEPLAYPANIGKGEVGELSQTFLHMIRDLEKSHEHLVRAAKLAVVGEMAATMAHEVRTPLGIMRSSAQMLQREPGLSETGKEMLEFILSESDRLNKLVSSLLDCARPRAPNFDIHHLHAIAQRAIGLLSMQAQKKAIRINAEFQAPNDLLSCDEEQILQVLLNLVMNALQILPPGGEVTLRSFGTKAGLAMNVDDNGPGIAEADRPKVFDPFFTQREGGIGLGLTVVQQIIRAHGGEITAVASPTGGARFHIFFPRTETPTTEEPH